MTSYKKTSEKVRYTPSKQVSALNLSPDSDSDSDFDDNLSTRPSNAIINKKRRIDNFFNKDLSEYLNNMRRVIAKHIYDEMNDKEIDINSKNIEMVNNTIEKYMIIPDFLFNNKSDNKIYGFNVASLTGGKTRRRRVQRKQSRRRR